ncbi:MAG TPA: pilus assembly PilX N-terminal domain-containing protein [Vicinamibacterales bacterium]|nr:pilus assembly PilX N-terminal domain-containing protein [Vicinamibacterales bacterium]
MAMTRNNQQGVALVITLFLMASLSALAVSLMFLSQTETSASRNYKTMSQARYAGEAGVHRAMNYLMSTAYTNTLTSTSFGNFNAATNPVQYSGNPVVLSSTLADSNYPDSAVKTAFRDAFGASGLGTLATGTGTVNYGATARLISMVQVNNVYGATGPRYIQTWQITATGSVPVAGSAAATVEVTATLERDIADANTFAVFATGTGCGAIDLQGNVQTASYDSTVGTTTTDSGGNVGTNGNMSIGGHVDVHGSLSSPRTGIGTCEEGATMTALTQAGSATVDGNNLVQLPQALNFEPPDAPVPTPPIGATNNCVSILANNVGTFPPATCSGTSTITIDPMGRTVKLGDISGSFVLKGGVYNVNSVGSGNLSVQSSANGTNNVVINLAGKTATGNLATVFDLNGNAVVNASMDPARLQITYGGTGAIEMTGGSQGAFMVYAPNASVTTHGNSDIWGSVLARQITSAGTPRFIYDRNLQSRFFTLGNWVMSSFSWKKFS